MEDSDPHKTHPDWNYTLEPCAEGFLLPELSRLLFRIPLADQFFAVISFRCFCQRGFDGDRSGADNRHLAVHIDISNSHAWTSLHDFGPPEARLGEYKANTGGLFPAC